MILLLILSLWIGQQSGTASVSGQIRDIHGMPRSNVRVSMMALDESDKDNTGHVTLTRLRESGDGGRFELENVPPGRYLIMAGLPEDPTYYPGVKKREEARVITITNAQGIANLDFSLARPIVVNIRGQVDIPFTLPLQVTIARQGESEAVLANVMADGTFEFHDVLPLTYDLRLASSVAPGVRVDASEGNVEDILLVDVPFTGRVVMDDGSPLSELESKPNTRIKVLSAAKSGLSQLMTVLSKDGRFTFSNARPGEYIIAVSQLPFGYYIKSATFGDVDLTKGPLVLENVAPADTRQLKRMDYLKDIRIVLTKSAPPGVSGVRVAGRVAGFTTFLESVNIISEPASAPMRRIDDMKVREDASFEILHVPAGRYTLTANGRFQSEPITIDVEKSDVTGILIRPSL